MLYQQIEPFKTRRAGALSGGMKQKLALCCTLIHEPVVLFLDEPTTGVDPVSRKELWAMLKKLKNQGITILVSTPYMDEASLCDRIALIQDGAFMKIDTPENIVREYKQVLWSVKSSDMSKLLKDLRANEEIKSSFAFGDTHHITIEDISQGELSAYLKNLGHTELSIVPIKAGIEDCFMELSQAS